MVPDVRAGRHLLVAQRHVLVDRLERLRATCPEHSPVLVGLGVDLGDVAGPVVLDLVVVERVDPRVRRVRGLQRRLALVERVLQPVPRQVERLGVEPRIGGDAALVVLHAGLVHVVAEVHDEVEVLGRHVVVGREVPVLPGVAGREREPELPRARERVRSRAGAAGRRDLAAGAEAVVVDVIGRQAVDLRVHRVAELRSRDHVSRGVRRAGTARRGRPRTPPGPAWPASRPSRPQRTGRWRAGSTARRCCTAGRRKPRRA